ncbi:MAG: type II toxin-antitoxin system VapC family toxin [Polyangiaceae bacterium]
MGYLIDTSIFVAIERGDLSASDVPEEPVAISAITASELLHGVHRADTAQRRGRRAAFVETVLEALPVLAIDLAVARSHAQIWADLRARGTIIGAHDLLIGATALAHGLTLATRNERHFRRIDGLKVVRW